MVKFRIVQIYVGKIVLRLLLKCWVEFNSENGSKWIAGNFNITSNIILSICGNVAARKWVVRHRIKNVGVLRYTTSHLLRLVETSAKSLAQMRSFPTNSIWSGVRLVDVTRKCFSRRFISGIGKLL